MALRRALNLEEAAAMTYRLLQAGDGATDFPAEWKGRIIDV
jgi:L-fuculose-phosphate aldolase